MLRFNRYDILSAYYLFGMEYHSGQWTIEYSYIGRALDAGFKPSLNFSFDDLTMNGKYIYNKLVSDICPNLIEVHTPLTVDNFNKLFGWTTLDEKIPESIRNWLNDELI